MSGGTLASSAGVGAQGIIVIRYTPSASVFKPDLVWLKDRTSANAHGLFDSVRGATIYLSSNAVTAETTDVNSLTAFLSNGFSLGTQAKFNTSGNNYISWMWKESVTSGFDIVSYTGTGAARTISHSLGRAPDFIIIKRRDGVNSFNVYHTNLGPTKALYLDDPSAAVTESARWNDTAPTASVFSVGTHAATNNSGSPLVAYLFASTTGFSSFGSYTGNAAADGPFIYTGFKPRFVMIKNTDFANNWKVFDTARDTYNLSFKYLEPNTTAAENGSSNTTDIDILSNGFKIRGTASTLNTSNGAYIYAAFAEQPFYYSAQPAAASSFVQAVAFLMGMTF